MLFFTFQAFLPCCLTDNFFHSCCWKTPALLCPVLTCMIPLSHKEEGLLYFMSHYDRTCFILVCIPWNTEICAHSDYWVKWILHSKHCCTVNVVADIIPSHVLHIWSVHSSGSFHRSLKPSHITHWMSTVLLDNVIFFFIVRPKQLQAKQPMSFFQKMFLSFFLLLSLKTFCLRNVFLWLFSSFFLFCESKSLNPMDKQQLLVNIKKY